VGINRCFCLMSVYLSRTSGLTREQRGPGRPKLAQRYSPTSRVTRTPLSGSKCQRSRSPGRFVTDVLARQAPAAVGVGTCWSRETAATLPSARWRKALRRPRGGRGGGIPWRPPVYSLVITHIYRLLNLRSTVMVCVF